VEETIVGVRGGVIGGVSDFTSYRDFACYSPDWWQWRPDSAMGYTIHDAYQILTSQDSVTLGEAEDLLWHRQVPLKVSIFTWRLLCDR
jgi:hypothetical protein